MKNYLKKWLDKVNKMKIREDKLDEAMDNVDKRQTVAYCNLHIRRQHER